jgi:hypothetical protein
MTYSSACLRRSLRVGLCQDRAMSGPIIDSHIHPMVHERQRLREPGCPGRGIERDKVGVGSAAPGFLRGTAIVH